VLEGEAERDRRSGDGTDHLWPRTAKERFDCAVIARICGRAWTNRGFTKMNDGLEKAISAARESRFRLHRPAYPTTATVSDDRCRG